MLDQRHIAARDETTPAGRRVLSIGVTGHRAARLDDVDAHALEAAVAATLDRIERAAGAVASDVEMRAITALADGADSIVAGAAMHRGWALASVLPFARGHYAQDFTSAQSLATYHRLIAVSARVFELVVQDRDAPAAYERAGRIVLAQADILLAVWDGGPAQGRGGTAQIVAEAVASDIPVIQIDPQARSAPALLWAGLTEQDGGQQDVATVPRAALDALPQDALARLIGRLLLPPNDPASRAKLAHPAEAGLRACLAVAAQMGVRGGPARSDPDARPDWVRYALRQTAQELGLPNAVVDRDYLDNVRSGLMHLIDAQIAWRARESQQMLRLEGRLHWLSTALFAATALAGIFGIRMQGKFTGVAERAEDTHRQLERLRAAIAADVLAFDTLQRRIAELTALLTSDLSAHHTAHR